MKKSVIVVSVLAALLFGLYLVLRQSTHASLSATPAPAPSKANVQTIPSVAPDASAVSSETDDESAEEQLTAEEAAEQAEERAVDAFDTLVDGWMDPKEGGVAMRDVDAFVAQFKQVPKARQEECLQRALNLIPDENAMLLVGVLMDKTQDKELVELVFNDVLNRDEDVKKPILQQIYKDKTHPCWADVAWILDVTEEK